MIQNGDVKPVHVTQTKSFERWPGGPIPRRCRETRGSEPRCAFRGCDCPGCRRSVVGIRSPESGYDRVNFQPRCGASCSASHAHRRVARIFDQIEDGYCGSPRTKDVLISQLCGYAAAPPAEVRSEIGSTSFTARWAGRRVLGGSPTAVRNVAVALRSLFLLPKPGEHGDDVHLIRIAGSTHRECWLNSDDRPRLPTSLHITSALPRFS